MDILIYILAILGVISLLKTIVVVGQNNSKQNIKIKYDLSNIKRLEYIGGSQKSNWIDLQAAERVVLNKGEFKAIPLGVAMQLPEGYEAHIVPRSSTYKNFRILQTNSMGVIDSSYSGDDDRWFFPALAMADTVIEKGDRICQFRIVHRQPEINFHTVTHLGNANRGGFGSTGK